MLRIILVAILVISVNSFSSEAQAQSRRTRFFQKVKEDLFGRGANAEQQKKAAQETAAKQQELRLQQARARQSAGKPAVGRVPTPVSNNSGNTNSRSRVPQLPSYQSRSKSGTAVNFSAPSRSPKTSLSSNTNAKYRPATRSQRNGFGFQVSLSGEDKLIVSNIDRSGNAEEAGLKRGDRVIEIGGIEATSVEEFEEIVKIMGQGDEMEFKIQRSGSEKEINVRFGTLPEVEDVEDSQVSRTTGEKRYDFAPPSNNEFRKSNSVLNQRNSNDQAGRQIQQLNKRIADQNQQIQQMRQQIQRLQAGYRGK